MKTFFDRGEKMIWSCKNIILQKIYDLHFYLVTFHSKLGRRCSVQMRPKFHVLLTHNCTSACALYVLLCITVSVKHSSGSIMFWRSISSAGTQKLYAPGLSWRKSQSEAANNLKITCNMQPRLQPLLLQTQRFTIICNYMHFICHINAK